MGQQLITDEQQKVIGLSDAWVSDGEGRRLLVHVLRGMEFSYGRGGGREAPMGTLRYLPWVLAAAEHLPLGELVDLDAVWSFRQPSILAALEEERVSLKSLLGLLLTSNDIDCFQYLTGRMHRSLVSEYLVSAGCRYVDPDYLSCADLQRLFTIVHEDPALEWVLILLQNTLQRTGITAMLPPSISVACQQGDGNGVLNQVGIIYGNKIDVFVALLSNSDERTEVARYQTAFFAKELIHQLDDPYVFEQGV